MTAWRERTPRERTVLAAGAAAAAIALAFALGWLPLARAHARLERELPALRASVAVLERQADEVRRLRAMPPPGAGAGAAPVATAESGAPAGARVTVLDAGRVRLTGDDVALAALLAWLTGEAAQRGLHVERARLDALPARGRVRVDITLVRS